MNNQKAGYTHIKMKNLTKIVVLVQIIDELSDGLIDGPLSAKINTRQHSSFLLVEGTHILIGVLIFSLSVLQFRFRITKGLEHITRKKFTLLKVDFMFKSLR